MKGVGGLRKKNGEEGNEKMIDRGIDRWNSFGGDGVLRGRSFVLAC